MFMLLLEYAQSPTTYPSGNEALVVLEFRVISICVILPNEWNTQIPAGVLARDRSHAGAVAVFAGPQILSAA